MGILEKLRLESFPKEGLGEGEYLVSHLLLRIPKVLIHCVLENLAEKVNLSVISRIQFDSFNERSGPHYDELLETISLI